MRSSTSQKGRSRVHPQISRFGCPMNVKPSQDRQIHAHIRNTQKPRACALAGQPCTSDTRGLLRRGGAYVKKSIYKEAMAEFEKAVSSQHRVRLYIGDGDYRTILVRPFQRLERFVF